MPQIPSVLNHFLDCYTWEESRQILFDNPKLLNEETDLILDQMVEFYQVAVSKKGRTGARIREHKELLQSCRENGISVAFAHKHGTKTQPLETLIQTFFYSVSLEEMHSIIKHYPELLGEKIESMVESLVGYSLAPSENLDIKDRIILLRLCREIGVEKSLDFYPNIRETQNTIIEFLNTNELHASEQLVRLHPELLTTEAGIIFNRFIETLTEQDHVVIACSLRDLLNDCKVLGVSEAYAHKKSELLQKRLSKNDPR